MLRVWLVILSLMVVFSGMVSGKPLTRRGQMLLDSLATVNSDGDAELEELDRNGKREEVSESIPVYHSEDTILRCAQDGRWPLPKKMDLVITWWTNSSQSVRDAQLFRTVDSEVVKTNTTVENQAEIKYLLRSYEKYGLLDHIGTVIILMDKEVHDKFGAPRFFDYKRHDIKIVTDHDIGVDNTGCFTCGKWSKWLGFHLIPDISEYFIFVPDDAFMLNQFDLAAFYDEQQAKPIVHGYGSWHWGECDGGDHVGSGHGPVLVNKCAWKVVAETYRDIGFKGGAMLEREHHPIDGICLYSNAMKSAMLFHDDGTSSGFYYECHTNAKENEHSHIDSIPKSVTFANIQGPGISDEYNAGPEQQAALAFFHTMYPSPSRFELSEEATSGSKQ